MLPHLRRETLFRRPLDGLAVSHWQPFMFYRTPDERHLHRCRLGRYGRSSYHWRSRESRGMLLPCVYPLSRTQSVCIGNSMYGCLQRSPMVESSWLCARTTLRCLGWIDHRLWKLLPCHQHCRGQERRAHSHDCLTLWNLCGSSHVAAT